MRRALFISGNVLAGLVLVLLILDPSRDRRPLVALLTAAVLLAWVVPRFLRPK
jgi:hypothetical protein